MLFAVAVLLPVRALAADPPAAPAGPATVSGGFPGTWVRNFGVRLGGEVVLDLTDFVQDAASIDQVGPQDDQAEVRSVRLQAVGTLLYDSRFSYKFAALYKGFDADPDRKWDVTDAAVTFTAAGNRFSIGRIKESFSYEVIGSTSAMPQSERVLNLFAASRNWGVSATRVFGDDRRTTASIGIYDNLFGYGNGGFSVSGRVSHLLWEGVAGEYLHIGASFRGVPSSDGTLRYRGRPASNVASDYVDTGIFAANGARHFGLEGLYSRGGLSVLGEVIMARTDAPTLGNPVFHGLYVIGSWVLTGEARPYDRDYGAAGRLVPAGRFGAPELVLRYAVVDLDDARVRGGRYQRVDIGVNWWITSRWKLGGLWGRTWLERGGTTGRTDSVLMRLQWVY